MAEAAKSLEDKAKDFAKDKGKDKLKDLGGDLVKNTWGRVCTWAFKSESGQARCEAFNHLYDAGMDAKDVGVDAAAGLATSETVVGPVIAAGKATWDTAKAVDDTGAFIIQEITGKKRKSLHDQASDYVKDKVTGAINDRIDAVNQMNAAPGSWGDPANWPPAI